MKAKIAACLASSTAVVIALLISAPAHSTPGFGVMDLVTDDNANLTALGLPAATHTDTELVNPWGISFSGGSPFWISDNGTGLATIYSALGVQNTGLTTKVAPNGIGGGTESAPTGTVFNGNANDFIVSFGGKSGSANFIFATEDGVISGRSGAVNGTQSYVGVDNSGSGAVYKGLAITQIGTDNVLFAANFHSGMVEEYNSNWGLINSFTDPNLPPVPAGTPNGQHWAPFNVQVLNGQLYVTYALQDAAGHDDVAGPGNGFVDVFTTGGVFVKRVVDAGAGDPLNSPWGLTIAPASFGLFANDLLVGNFGDGEIDAFNLATDTFDGVLSYPNGNPIDIPGLWDITIGNGGAGVNHNAIYFTAGLPLASDPEDLEQAGVFGLIMGVPEPSTVTLLLAGLAGMFWFGRKRPRIAGTGLEATPGIEPG